jgi:opacity protein-like surface antigen
MRVAAVAAIIAALAGTAVSHAAPAASPWTGFYAGVHAGAAAAHAPNTSGSGVFWDGLGFRSAEFGAFAGLNALLDRDVVVGVEADATWLGLKNRDDDGLQAAVNWMASVDLRAGRLINAETLLYGKFGWGVVNFEVPPGSTFHYYGPGDDSLGAGARNLAALQAGIGMEAHLSKKWLARVEGVYTWATERYLSGSEGVVDSFPDVLAARVGLSYAFGNREERAGCGQGMGLVGVLSRRQCRLGDFRYARGIFRRCLGWIWRQPPERRCLRRSQLAIRFEEERVRH